MKNLREEKSLLGGSYGLSRLGRVLIISPNPALRAVSRAERGKKTSIFFLIVLLWRAVPREYQCLVSFSSTLGANDIYYYFFWIFDDECV